MTCVIYKKLEVIKYEKSSSYISFFPHYRKAIVEALAKSENFQFSFIGSAIPIEKSIKCMGFSDDIEFYDAPCKTIGPLVLQNEIFVHVNKINPDVIIVLGNVWYISYWLLSLKCKLLNKVVLMWTHGWINNNENFLKKGIINLFYRLSNGLLLYGEKAKEIGISNGFDKSHLFVIGNCLDFDGMSKIFDTVRLLDREALKYEMQIPSDASVIMCSARLTKLCQFDFLIKAVHKIDNKKITIVLIGDGPEKEALYSLAETLNVDVRFIGACYDENVLAKYYHLADVTVSPGKVGLTAIHSLTYGTPVISHNDFNRQMPEIDAVIVGVNGGFFEYGNLQSLTDEIVKWINCKENNANIIEQCRNVILNRFSPSSQVKFIEAAITKCIM